MNDAKPTYEELEYQVKILTNEARWRAQAQRALKEREEALRANEEKYRLIFENVFDIIFTFDREFKLLDVSPSIKRALGYKPEDIIGKPFPDLNILTPDSLEAAIPVAIRALSGKSIVPTRYEFIARDGTRKIGEITANPLFRNGEVVAVISIARDMTNMIPPM